MVFALNIARFREKGKDKINQKMLNKDRMLPAVRILPQTAAGVGGFGQARCGKPGGKVRAE